MSVTVGAVLEKTQEMEYLLKEDFGATGKDLNECLDSIPGVLPPDLAKKVRFVATIQTRLTYERGYRYDGDENDLWWLCDTIISRLSHNDEFVAEETQPEEPEASAAGMRRAAVPDRSHPVEAQPSTRPWYRSTWFMLALFLFLPPAWAVWMLLDRDQRLLTKGVATIVLLAFSIAGLTAYSLLTSTHTLGSTSTPAVVKRMPTPVAAAEAELQATAAPIEAASATRAPTLTPTRSPSARAAACTLDWQEYQGDALAGKNRNQVWNGLVKNQVAGSGLVAAKFYVAVAEQNPSLQADGYVFKKGKTYRLPKCK